MNPQQSPSSARRSERMTVTNVRLEDLRPNPHQPRQALDERDLRELMVSIEANGLLQPVLVRRAAPPLPPGSFVVIAGHRRVEAFRRLKKEASSEERSQQYSTIPTWEYSRELNDDGALLALVENMQRADLSPLEEAEGLARIQDLRPELRSARDLSAATGFNEERIRRLLRLRDAPSAVKNGVTKGVLVPVLREDGTPELGEGGKGKRQHVRLDLMTALEFQKLHKHLLLKMTPKAADHRVERAIERSLQERWGKDRVVAFVKAAIDGRESEPKETPALPAYRSTSKQLVLYRERLGSLVTSDRRILREELESIAAQLAARPSSEPSAPVLSTT